MAERFRVPAPPHLPPMAAGSVAVGLPAIAYGIELVFRAWVEPIPFVLFFLVVAIASWVGGPRVGAASVIASGLLGYTFIAGSQNEIRVAGAPVATALFLLVGALVAALGAVARRGFTERERAAENLAQALRIRDAFLSMASHQLKTPITSLQLFTEALSRGLQQRPRSFEEMAGKLAAIERQARRLTRLVDDLLDISRIVSGRMDLRLEEVDLTETVRDVLSRFSLDVQHVRAPVSVDARAPVLGRWDRTRVDHIVTNLLSNALKFGEGKPIQISVTRQGAVARLVVSDHGMGIDEHDRARIFERFERGNEARGYAGFGLGLWIAREAAEALGGHIEVESARNEGSRFTVVLPLVGPEQAGPGEPPR